MIFVEVSIWFMVRVVSVVGGVVKKYIKNGKFLVMFGVNDML